MQVKRKLALFAFASGLVLAVASAEAAPAAGISQGAPAVSASENTNAPIQPIQKAWWHRHWWYWHHHCWHCWHHW
jgi:hypothetical protein